MPFAIEDVAGNVSYILNDPVSQPQKMLYGSPGAVTWQRVAGIFGDIVSQPVGVTGANPQRFPGQQEDPTGGLYYNYFRDYEPATGRYIEPDPAGLHGGINLYAYVGGNPTGRLDPHGLWAVGISLGGSGEAGVYEVGAGATGSVGGGVFTSGQDISLGGYATGGAFAGGPGWGVAAPACPSTSNWAAGAYAGGGAGIWTSSADNVRDLSGPFETYSLNAG